MSITRIQNNQITDSTIVAYAKLQTGSLTGNLFAPTVTLNSNVTINGNLFLANTGNTVTINATNTYINDPIVVYNNGYVGGLGGYDIGMIINRNLSSLGPYGSVNTAWVWVEDDQAFEAITTTDVGAGATSINKSGFANVKAGNTTLISATVTGALAVSGASTLNTITGASFQGAIGNVAPTTAAFTTVTASGITQLTNSTNNDGTQYSSGALQVAGGAGIGGNLYVSGNVIVAANVYSSTGNINVVTVTGNSAQFFGNAAGFGALYTGIASGYVYQPQTVLQNSTNFNGYAQVNHQNINSGSDATTDFVVTSDAGNENTYYLDMGITSSGYDNTTPTNALGTSVFANDSYLYAQGKAGFAGGNLTVGTSIPGTMVRLIAGGVDAANVVASLTNTGFIVNAATSSSSTSTGALRVAGGAGIQGAVYAGSLYDNGNRVLTSFSSSGAGNLTVSINNPTSSTIELTATGPGVAQWGGTTQLPVVTTDAYGRISTASNIALGTIVVTEAGNTSEITANASTGKVGFNLTTTGVAAGNYGNASTIPTIVVDSKGRVTEITTNTVATSFNVAGTSGTATVEAGSTLTFAGTYGVTVSVGQEYANISTPQDLRTTANPAFNNITGASFQGVIGNVTPAAGTFTTGAFNTATTGGLQAVAIGNVTPGTAAFTTLSASGSSTLDTITGASFQGVIGNVTPAAGTFTSLTAQTESVGGLQAVAIGNVTPGTAAFTTATTGGLQAVAIGNVTPGTGAFTNLTSSTTAQLNTVMAASYQGVIGNVTPAAGTFTSGAFNTATTGGLQAVAIGNVTPGTAVFTSLESSTTATLNTVTAASYQGVIGNVTPSAGTFTSGAFNTTTTGGLQAVAIGNVTPGTAAFTTATTGGLQAVAIGNVTPGSGVFTSLTAQTESVGGLQAVAIGNVTPGTGAFTALTSSTTAQLNTVTAASYQGAIGNATPNTAAFTTLTASGITQITDTTQNNGTTYSSGALQVAGGAGFGANVYIAGNLIISGNVYETSTEIITGNEIVAGIITANSGTASTSTTTGALLVNGGAGVTGAVYAASFQGAIGNVAPSTGAFTSLSVSGTTSINTLTGASFQGVIGNVTPNLGYFTTIAATTVNADTIGNIGAKIIGDGGFLSNIIAANIAGTVATANVSLYDSVTEYTTNQTFYPVFSNISTTGNTTQGVNSSLTYNPSTGTLSASALSGAITGTTGTFSSTLGVTGATTLTTATTGGLQAVAIGNVTPGTAAFTTATTGGLQAVAIGNVTPGTAAFTTLTTTGTVIASGNIVAAASTTSTTTTTGALIVPNGGVGIAGNLNAGVSGTSIHKLLGNTIVGYGGISSATFVVNENNVDPLLSSNSPTAHIIGHEGAPAVIQLDTITTGPVGSLFMARTANGSAASPSAVTAGKILGGFTARGYATTGFTTPKNGPGLALLAAQDFTDTNQGTSLSLSVTPNNSDTAISALIIADNGNVSLANSLFVTDTVTVNEQLKVNSFSTFYANVRANAIVHISNGTPTVNSTTGALVVDGGAAIFGNINTSGQLFVGAQAQNSQFTNAITVERGTSTTGAGTQYTQHALVNATNTGSSDFIAYADDYAGPSNDHGWADMGFTGSTFDDPVYSITKAHDAYLFGSAPSAAYGGNLILATDYTGSHNDIVIGVGSFYANSEVARFHGNTSNNGYLTLDYTTVATNTTSGALRVAGGVGIVGNLYAGAIENTPIGNTSASSGAFTTLSATGASTLNTVTAISFQGVIGNITPNTGAFTSLTAQTESVGGLQAVAIGNVTPGTAAFTTATTGGLQAVAIGNVTPGTAAFTTATTGGLQAVAIGNVTPGTGAFTSLNSSTTAQLNTVTAASFQGVIGNVTPTTGFFTTVTATTVNAATIGNTGATLAGTLSTAAQPNITSVGTLTGLTVGGSTALDTVTVASLQGNIGNVTPWSGAFTTLSASVYANVLVANVTSSETSTSTTTGALRVAGGAGIGENVYVGGNIVSSGAALLNTSQSSNYDFKVAGVNTTNLLWARPNSTYDVVIVGNTLPAGSIVNGAKLQINSTDAMIIPTGTQAQRPDNTGYSAVPGMLRYNTTTNGLEFYNGSNWQSPSSTVTVITDQQFTATGSTAAFTLTSETTTASTIVSINGVLQIPTLAYSVSGTTLTFTENPANGDIIDVRVLTTTSTVSQLNDVTGAISVETNTNSGVILTTNSMPQYRVDTRGGFVTQGANATVASSGVATTVDTLFANSYSSAEYTITATIQGTNIRQIDKVHLIHNGDATSAGTATVMVYGTVNTAGNSLVSYSAATSGNIAQLKATTTNNNTILRITRNYQAI